MPCDAVCRKIIVDTGRLARVARVLLETAEKHQSAYEEAKDDISDDEKELLRAESEVDCHRAELILRWAEERHKSTIRMNGGEYEGPYDVSGTDAPRKKE